MEEEKEEEKNEKGNFLNHSLFIQPYSAFGRSIYILGVSARALSAGWPTAHPADHSSDWDVEKPSSVRWDERGMRPYGSKKSAILA